jgi:guanylate kinase
MSRNNIIVISGPSGSGKSTLIDMLLRRYSDLQFSISHTTRGKRKGEIDGCDYHFLDEAAFRRMVESGSFVEWAEVHGHLYGTSWEEVETKAGGGKDLVLDVDVQGARHLRQRFPRALYIFIIPPSLAELKRRLIERRGEGDSEIERRFQKAKDEMNQYTQYDYVIVNDRREDAGRILGCIYTAFAHHRNRMEQKILSMLEEGR